MPSMLQLIFELLGTVAFAASGAITALSKGMDVFGVVTLGLVTAVGGGCLRDVILGDTPPAIFTNPIYAVVAVVVSLIIFIPAVRRLLFKKHRIYDIAMLLMDSIGLGVFTVVGVQMSFTSTGEFNVFLMMFVGLVTGTGGGILRDMMAGNTPYIFVKHFYACASLIGAACCIVIWRVFNATAATYVGAAVVIVLRLLAAHYHWSLPKAKGEIE